MPKLDRIPHFDTRSRGYPMRTLLPERPERVKTMWETRPEPLDQGEEGACVAFGFSHELAAVPVRHPVDNTFAFTLYEAARAQDRAMGNDWPEGASVLAGAKACVDGGWVGQYRWAFGIDDVIDTLCAHGPVVLGVAWYDGMYTTDERGLVTVAGQLVGGHAIMACGYWPDHPEFDTDVVVWQNSWGPDYGIGGVGYIRVSDLADLLADRGEACVPTDTPLPDTEPGRPESGGLWRRLWTWLTHAR